MIFRGLSHFEKAAIGIYLTALLAAGISYLLSLQQMNRTVELSIKAIRIVNVLYVASNIVARSHNQFCQREAIVPYLCIPTVTVNNTKLNLHYCFRK
jgi:hypothetical protein